MFLIECVNAYMAVQALMEVECDYRTAHALVVLKKRLLPHVEFFSAEEMKLVEAYAARGEDGKVKMDGSRFVFAPGADTAAYARRRAELGTVEVEEEFPVLHAPLPPKVKPVHIEALEKFIEFQVDGGEGA